MWTLHHRRMLESLGKVLVSSLEEKCSCGVSELYLQGWCPAPLTWFTVPSSLTHPQLLVIRMVPSQAKLADLHLSEGTWRSSGGYKGFQ